MQLWGTPPELTAFQFLCCINVSQKAYGVGHPSGRGALHYAQLFMAHDAADWSTVAECLELIGPRIKELRDRRAIGAATMDFHLPFCDNKVAISSTVPARIALLAGRNLIDVETSVYLTSSEG